MWALLLIFAIAVLSLAMWVIIKADTRVRLVIFLFSLLTACWFGYVLGTGFERMKNDDQYVFRFSQYSSYLRNLAELKSSTN